MERENSTRCISWFDDDFLINAQLFFMDYLFLFNTLQLEEGNCLKNFAQVYTYSIHKN